MDFVTTVEPALAPIRTALVVIFSPALKLALLEILPVMEPSAFSFQLERMGTEPTGLEAGRRAVTAGLFIESVPALFLGEEETRVNDVFEAGCDAAAF